jgi:hypothetical protein
VATGDDDLLEWAYSPDKFDPSKLRQLQEIELTIAQSPGCLWCHVIPVGVQAPDGRIALPDLDHIVYAIMRCKDLPTTAGFARFMHDHKPRGLSAICLRAFQPWEAAVLTLADAYADGGASAFALGGYVGLSDWLQRALRVRVGRPVVSSNLEPDDGPAAEQALITTRTAQG